MNFDGKQCIVTGGANGIGRELAGRLDALGANVAVLDIDKAGLEATKALHPNIDIFPCDLTDPDAVEFVINAIHSEQGSIDVLVNNAGILFNSPLVHYGPQGIVKHDINDWKKVIDVNLNALFYAGVNVAEKMLANRTRGLIVNISSVCASGNRGQSAYSAAKAGVNALTATWAKELGVMGTRVIGIAPGYTDTPSTRHVLSEATLKEIKKDIPLRRLGHIEEIVDGIIAAMQNDFFHGKVLELDGGLIL